MTVENSILMPKLGLTMTEGIVTSWNAKVGDRVLSGNTLFVVETDKIATEVPAEIDLVIDRILVPEGETALVGATVATWRPLGSKPELKAVATAPNSVNSPTPRAASVPQQSKTITALNGLRDGRDRLLATPLARRIAKQNEIDLGHVNGTGPRGRIKAADVAILVQDQHLPSTPPAPIPTASMPSELGTTRRPTSIERSIARRVTEAKQSIPHFYVLANADVTDLLNLRQTLNTDGTFPKVTVNHLLLLAMIRALKAVPEYNALWTDDGIVTLRTVDVGVAVDTPRGIFVPVLKNVGEKSLASLVDLTDALVHRTREGTVEPDALAGGAISLSNVGMYGAAHLVPIINLGQSAILGVGGTKPVFRPDAAGAPILRQEIGLTLSCDHRVHSGASAARFLGVIVSLLEAPLRLLRV